MKRRTPSSTRFPYTTLFRSCREPSSPPCALPGSDRRGRRGAPGWTRSEEHTSELQSQSNLVCRLLLEKKKTPRLSATRWGCRRRSAARGWPWHRRGSGRIFFFFNDTATTEIYTLSLHDALPILRRGGPRRRHGSRHRAARTAALGRCASQDRKSTRLNSSHSQISYAVFCLK